MSSSTKENDTRLNLVKRKLSLPAMALAGENKEALTEEALLDHFWRNDYKDIERELNSSIKTTKAKSGHKKLRLDRDPSSEVEVTFWMEVPEEINNQEDYAEKVFESIIDELIARDQGVYEASTNFTHRILPEISDERGIDELEVLYNEMDKLGGSIERINRAYHEGGLRPSRLIMPYAWTFEAHLAESDMDKGEIDGFMPLGRTNEDEMVRNRGFFRRYLGNVIEIALEEYGGTETEYEEELRQIWLDYAD